MSHMQSGIWDLWKSIVGVVQNLTLSACMRIMPEALTGTQAPSVWSPQCYKCPWLLHMFTNIMSDISIWTAMEFLI